MSTLFPITTDITAAVRALRHGGLVGLPTETVYGLAADADNCDAVQRIFTVKGRPSRHPLIVHVTGPAALRAADSWVTDVPTYAAALANALWPGPVTLVLPRSSRCPDAVTGGLDTVAVRSPRHPIAQQLLATYTEHTGRTAGLAAPSANRFGRVSPTCAADVAAELGEFLQPDLDCILQGGPSEVGVESTIIDCTAPAPALLRSGAIGIPHVLQIAHAARAATSTTPAPGTLASHYAPNATVLLAQDAADAARLAEENPGSGFLALAETATPVGVLRLTTPASIAEYAHVLYRALRDGDERGCSRIIALPPRSDDPLAAAILDRLTRAAHEAPAKE